jgi:hypothetical protein
MNRLSSPSSLTSQPDADWERDLERERRELALQEDDDEQRRRDEEHRWFGGAHDDA